MMEINGVEVVDTFAEAFQMTATRIIVTAENETWVRHATNSVTGFATSVIGCGVEAGVELKLREDATPDGRCGASVLFFAVSGKELQKQITNRIGQCLLTAPSSAVYAGMDEGKTVMMGKAIRYFGDGFQISKKIGNKRFWRIPVMDGEFICEDVTHRKSAIGGGNFLIISETQRAALEAAERAVQAISEVEGCITPFPGGVVRSGSKVGSKYPKLIASTNHEYCPTLRMITASKLQPKAKSVLEIVIDGLTSEFITESMRVGILAACSAGRDGGVIAITASNFGGKLGKYHYPLREILA